MIALLRITVWVLFFSVLVANSDECLATAGIAVNSGNIVRADPITQMNVSITLSNVDLTDLVGGDPMQTIYTRLAIFLTSYRNNTAVRLKYANEPSSTTTPSTTTTTTPTAPPLTLTGFSISFTDTPQVLDNGQYKNVTINLQITDYNDPAVLPTLLQTKQRSGTNASYQVVPISVTYQGAQSSPAAVPYDVELITAVANEDPSGFTVTPKHKSLEMQWTHKDPITFNDSVSRAPSGVIVYVVDLSLHPSMAFDGTVYNADESQQVDKAGSCTLTTGSGLSTCTMSCPSGQFLASLGDAPPEGVFTFSQPITVDSGALGDLNPNVTYAVFARYLPDSVGSSVPCVTAKPLINFSLVEMNNDKLEAKEGNPACFIATAAYGTPLHRNLNYLRWFRDKFLLRSKFGRLFVHEYYRYGPELAEIIATKQSLRLATRIALWPMVTAIMFCKEASVSTLVLALTTLYLLIAFVVHRFSRSPLERMGIFRYLEHDRKSMDLR